MKHNLIGAWLIVLALFFSGSALAQELVLTGPENVTQENLAGQQITPASIVYQDIPYLFWSSNSVPVTGDQDFDILYSTMINGEWATDTLLTGTSTGYDHVPQPIIFRGDLYLFWSSDEATWTGNGITDIVFSSFDGDTWTQTVSLTSSFNGMGDYNPWPVVFNSELFVFFEWFSLDSGSYEIACMSYDGSQWSDVEEITSSSDGHNFNPTASVNANSLILAWESSSDVFTEPGIDSSIITRSLTSGTWSNYSSLSGTAGPRNQSPFSINYEGSTWVFWSSNSQAISLGNDFDIVARCFSSGSWNSTVHEISSGGSGNESAPTAVVFGDRLAVSWVTASQEFSPGTDTDIVVSLFDGQSWSTPLDISQNDDLNDAGGQTHKSPALIAHGQKLLIIWEHNAPTDYFTVNDTWLMMAILDDTSGKDTTIYWLALISFICIGVAAIGLKFRKN